MAFDVIITQNDFTFYDDIPAGTLFAPANTTNYFLKLGCYAIEDECTDCECTNVFEDYDACVDIRTGEVRKFTPRTECTVYTHSELKLAR